MSKPLEKTSKRPSKKCIHCGSEKIYVYREITLTAGMGFRWRSAIPVQFWHCEECDGTFKAYKK